MTLLHYLLRNFFCLPTTITAATRSLDGEHIPPPPLQEAISITILPLPPVVNEIAPGSCTAKINPQGTGCTAQSTGLQGGTFTPDGNHIVATINFAGAPLAPHPASIYSGQQLILVKADGNFFASGDAWKCITCGVPEGETQGVNLTEMTYESPQMFSDARRLLAGAYIIDCGSVELINDECTPETISVYPIHLRDTMDDSGPGAAIRELRLHPDGQHLGFNIFSFNDGKLGQTAYLGRLHFNPAPKTGSVKVPRYDLVQVKQLFDPNAPQVLEAVGDELHINHSAITIGELRGFSSSGDEVLYIGYPAEACNIDVFAAHLTTGSVRRLTSHPGYVDPVQMSPDDRWMVIMDTRSTDRTLFMDGLRGIPPITDMMTATACSSVRNNGVRRFFQPWLLDRHGDRSRYFGQEINGASHGTPGSGAVDDPEWNGRADPWFSPDGTKIMYWQAQTVSPACGGENPLPCYASKEPGGRQERLMVAHLTSRKPSPQKQTIPVPDRIPWATPYEPGTPAPSPRLPKAGTYILKGRASGHATVEIVIAPDSRTIRTIAASFNNFSNDGLRTVSGYQDVSASTEGYTLDRTTWYSDIVQTGVEPGRQKTSEGGFYLAIDVMKNELEANGTLVTEVDGVVYRQPKDGT